MATVIPELIELTRLAAAASTDAEAKRALPEGAREIVNATLQVSIFLYYRFKSFINHLFKR